jgi:hypothetical protein
MVKPFRDQQGALVEKYTSKGTTVTNASYCNLLRNHTRPGFRLELHGLLSTGAFSLRDNARSRTVRVAAETVRQIQFECFPQLWATQEDSWWKDFPIRWRSAWGGAWVSTHAAKWLFSRGIQTLVKHWRTCFERNGKEVEKWQALPNLVALN